MWVSFLAILFILYATFFLGYRSGRSVPDESGPGKKYFRLGADVCLLLLIALSLFSYGQYILAVAIPIAFIAARYFFPFEYAYAPVSGIILAAATLLSTQSQTVIFVTCLVMNFLLGVITTKKVLRASLAQPLAAAAFLLIIQAL